MEKEPKQEMRKYMPCVKVERSIAELKQEGWEHDWSFDTRLLEQWNNACARVEKMNDDDLWEPILVSGQNEMECKAGIAHIYKRKN